MKDVDHYHNYADVSRYLFKIHDSLIVFSHDGFNLDTELSTC